MFNFKIEFAKYRPIDPYKETSQRNQASKVGPPGGRVNRGGKENLMRKVSIVKT